MIMNTMDVKGDDSLALSENLNTINIIYQSQLALTVAELPLTIRLKVLLLRMISLQI